MKKLEMKQMEVIEGGIDMDCLGLATTVMTVSIASGLGALFGGIITYYGCTLIQSYK